MSVDQTTIHMTEHMAQKACRNRMQYAYNSASAQFRRERENNLWKKFDSRKDNLISFGCVNVYKC